jgi:hypothetical protein
VSSAGHATCTKSIVGLSAPFIQSQRKLQPGWRALGNAEQVLDEMPPYCSPQPEEGAPHSLVQPLNMPTPPPGIERSNWFIWRSVPKFVAWTIMVLPAMAVEVKVSLRREVSIQSNAMGNINDGMG